MSHYVELKVQFTTKNEPELISALKKVYGEDGVEVHQEAADLKLYHGGRATGTTQYSLDGGDIPKCHLIVRQHTMEKALGRSVATNDLGFRREETGKFSVYADEAGYPEHYQNRVAQEYAVAVGEREMQRLRAEGYQINKMTEPDGTIRIRATSY